MEKQVKKKEWKIPELIVIVRSKPEEAVLAVCKDTLRPGPNISGVNNCKPNPISCTATGIS